MTKVVPKGFLVNAYVDNGKSRIGITPIWTDNAKDHQEWLRKYNAKHYKDWQTSYHESLKELRSCIMVQYGIAWFNRARRKMNILSLQHPEKIHG